MKRVIFICAVALTLYSCTKKEQNVEYGPTVMTKLAPARVADAYIKKVESVSYDEVNGKDYADYEEVAPPPALKSSVKFTAPVINKPIFQKKKIIKDGRMGLQVENLVKAKQQIDTLVKALGGYYASENLRNSDTESGYELTIRIPVDRFEQFVTAQEASKNKILYKEVSARDVTEEFIDLETRLNSKRTALIRYNEIMKKASTMKDIVSLQDAIRELEEEIESTEGKLRYLTDCVDYSTLSLTLGTSKDFVYQPPKRDNFWEKFKESVVEGWFGLVDFVLSLFSIWPFLTSTIVAFIFIRLRIKRWWKKRKARRAQQ